MRLDSLRDRRVGILGYGREGRAALAVLRRYGLKAEPTVLVEDGTVPETGPTICAPFAEQLLDFDVLLRSPGIRVDHPALVRFRAQGGAIVNPGSIFLSERPDARVIGVTGSKGKSTTAALLAHLLEACGRAPILAGNIGVPLLEHLDSPRSLVVAELSSYQLTDLEGRLAMGLMTRLFDEHLDWHGSRERYHAAKLRIGKLLAGNPLLINAADPVLLAATSGVEGRVPCNQPPGLHRRRDGIWRGDSRRIRERDLALIGRHNLDNAVLALEAALRLDCPMEDLERALGTFHPLPHRLENLGTAAGRHWINDSIATSPHATRAALDALCGGPLTLIAGGLPRPTDWQVVIDGLTDRGLVGLVTLPDNGRAIAQRLVGAGLVAKKRVRAVSDVEQAVEAALELSDPGCTVVLSPGAPSFPIYRDFEERGERFRAAVARYRDRSTA